MQADGGTLFLDEIGEMPLELQPKLLRALQERKVRPVGGERRGRRSTRASSPRRNRDLEEEVEEKRFREDLYYRINVVRVAVPPLRERDGDVLELAQHFLEQLAARSAASRRCGISPRRPQKLIALRWPGNVRELENCMERAAVFARFDELTVDDLPEKVRSYAPDRFVVVADDADGRDPRRARAPLRIRALALFGGNKSRAAQLLGIDRRTLYRKIEQWEGLAKAGGNGAS